MVSIAMESLSFPLPDEKTMEYSTMLLRYFCGYHRYASIKSLT